MSDLLKQLKGPYETRAEAETHILELANSIPLEHANWINGEIVDRFIEAWFNLAKYYARHTDTEIGVEALSEYINFTRLLTNLSNDASQAIANLARDKKSSLESAMDEIVKEAVTNLYHRGA